MPAPSAFRAQDILKSLQTELNKPVDELSEQSFVRNPLLFGIQSTARTRLHAMSDARAAVDPL